jgi:xanthine dehydrogenase YagS FAD-binding subunit
MHPFVYRRAEDPDNAVAAGAATGVNAVESAVQFIAGGTTLLDLMKLDVMRPGTLVDINPLAQSRLGRIETEQGGIRFGGLVRMADAADHETVRRDYPVIADSLKFAASAQLRNMASLAGNLLQRTRCPYFRDTSWTACNKRRPGSGCAALGGVNRMHAVLGTSENCIATYPGDLAQALIALDATVQILGPKRSRTIPVAQLHRLPEAAPNIETQLAPGELIASIQVPAGPWTRRSLYRKIRDRESYEFALASAAVALDLNDGMVRDARIALGGVATVPWRARAAEAQLTGKRLDEDTATLAAQAAFAEALPREHNGFKIELGQRTLVRALLEAGRMEI